ncbi:hypothetical protein [Thomasclavelia ramosa]|uniref:Uncharacterized protein n=1 Tax=Thomasclavelia ramosa TaxID=1547 RepID=A0A3E3E9R9_9FIRM|nr:hypothetical protein [Thomasclavelia ramosa]RGD78798.1 hypothetical protein DXB93_16895 [Thomasclavelia ramosa]
MEKDNFIVAITGATLTVLGSRAFVVYTGAFVLSKVILIAAAKTFCKSFLTSIGVDYLVTDV